MKRLAIAIGIGLCSFGCVEPEPDPELGVESSELAVPGSCINPVDPPYSATPNVSTDDDRAAFQAAITAAITNSKQLCIPPGVFDIGISAAPRSLDLNNASALTIAGSGPRTVLKFKGPGLGSSAHWVLFNVRGVTANVTFRDFVIDGNEVALGSTVGTNTHGIRLGTGDATSTVTSVTITDVEIRNVRNAAVHLYGAAGHLVDDARISHDRFIDNGRGVLVDGYAQRLAITHNQFLSSSSTDVEVPQSSVGTAGVAIAGNVILKDSGCSAIQLFGNSDTARFDNALITGNIIDGGTIRGGYLSRAAIVGNTVRTRAGACDAVIDMDFRVSDLTIAANHLERVAGTTAGYVVSVADKTGATSSEVTVHGNVLVQRTSASLSRFRHTTGLLVDAVDFQFYGTSVDTHVGVLWDSTTTLTGATVNNSAFNGALGGGRLLAAINPTFTTSAARQLFVGNRGSGLKWGVYFVAGTTYTDPPMVASNVWSTTGGGDFGFASTTSRINVAGNASRPWLQVTGAPTWACQNGSLATRTDGTAGATLYVCEMGAWVAK